MRPMPSGARALVVGAEAPPASAADSGPPISSFELMPAGLFYLPIVLCWTLLALRYRSLSLPTAVNPMIEAGGLCGESKAASLVLLGPEGRRRLAPFATVATAGRAHDLGNALAAAKTAGLTFPMIVKPDIGCRGTGVRIVADAAALGRYLEAFPSGARVMLQRLEPGPGEAGIFWLRRPGEKTGRIISLTLKYFPEIVGDGRSTVETLIRADRRAGRMADLYLARHAAERLRILARGEVFPLTYLGNHCRGAVFRDGARFVTAALEDAIGRIAREIPEFHLGRFDVRFESLAQLMRGHSFTIIEFNGVGSEATHIWDRRARLADAYRFYFGQLAASFAIGAANRARGFRPTGALGLFRRWRHQQKLMRRYPKA